MVVASDAQIHSKDGEGFGSGNMGEEGVQRFLRTHACTSECEALGLTPLRPGETDEQLARRLQVRGGCLPAEFWQARWHVDSSIACHLSQCLCSLLEPRAC